jgi:single-strand DNA-binding protein
MLNNVSLVGRLTRDPEMRYISDGTAVAKFTMAINRNFKSSRGEYEADFVNCTVWRKLAENTANYCKKGSLVGVTGRIQSRSFEGKEGDRVYVTEVVADRVRFLEKKKETPAVTQ